MLEFVTGGLGDVHVCILISKIIILYFFLYFFSWTQNEIKMLVLKNKKCCAVSNTAIWGCSRLGAFMIQIQSMMNTQKLEECQGVSWRLVKKLYCQLQNSFGCKTKFEIPNQRSDRQEYNRTGQESHLLRWDRIWVRVWEKTHGGFAYMERLGSLDAVNPPLEFRTYFRNFWELELKTCGCF